MNKPTREQVFDWLRKAQTDDRSPVAELESIAALAYEAGRQQGAREERERLAAKGKDAMAQSIADMIEHPGGDK